MEYRPLHTAIVQLELLNETRAIGRIWIYNDGFLRVQSEKKWEDARKKMHRKEYDWCALCSCAITFAMRDFSGFLPTSFRFIWYFLGATNLPQNRVVRFRANWNVNFLRDSHLMHACFLFLNIQYALLSLLRSWNYCHTKLWMLLIRTT